MKNTITVWLITFLFIATSFIDESEAANPNLRIGATIDYNLTAMENINNMLTSGSDFTEANSGFGAIMNLDIALAPFLMAGLKTGFVNCRPASSNYNYVLYNQTSTFRATLLPVEIGLTLILTLPSTPLSIEAGTFIGYGFAFASYKYDINVLGQLSNTTVHYTGGNLVGELPVAINIKITPMLSAVLKTGYRWALIPQLSQSLDNNYEGIPGISIPIGSKGDILKDGDDKDLPVDFSGFSIGAGFNINL